jgi:gamma-glutamylcyclotransferase (GGCT)/AIG2-like uncharacterized protein YtfP
MRLFLYGTLLDPAELASRGGQAELAVRSLQATLHGWRRVSVRGGRYPTLCRSRTGLVHGALVDVPARALGRLTAYEGPAYRLMRVVVATARGNAAAYTWIAPARSSRPWKE